MTYSTEEPQVHKEEQEYIWFIGSHILLRCDVKVNVLLCETDHLQSLFHVCMSVCLPGKLTGRVRQFMVSWVRAERRRTKISNLRLYSRRLSELVGQKYLRSE